MNTKTWMTAIASAALAASAFAFNDEPDELNWDSLGGTLTGFRHLRGTCAADRVESGLHPEPAPRGELFEELHPRWRTISYIATAAATPALSDSKPPGIGSSAMKSHFSRTRREMPFP